MCIVGVCFCYVYVSDMQLLSSYPLSLILSLFPCLQELSQPCTHTQTSEAQERTQIDSMDFEIATCVPSYLFVIVRYII